MSGRYIISLHFFIFISITLFGQNKIDSLFVELKKKTNDNKIDILNQIATEYYKTQNYEKAVKYSTEALNMATGANYFNGKKQAEETLGETYYDSNRFDSALVYYKKCVENNIITNNKKQQSYFLHLIGVSYRKLNDYNKALEYGLKSLKIAEEIDNKLRIARTSNSIGIIYHALEKYDDALKYYTIYLNVSDQLGNKDDVANACNNIGIIHRIKKDYNKALENYSKAMQIYEELHDTSGLALIYNNIGYIYLLKDKIKEALEFNEKSLKLELEKNNTEGIAYSYSSFADIYLHENDFSKAIEYKNKALSITTENELKRNIYDSLSIIYEKIADYKNSLKYHRLYTAIKDTMLNIENNKQLTDLRTRYDVEKKEKENELLKKEKLADKKVIKYQKISGIAGIFVLILVVLLAIFFFKGRQKEKQTNKLLTIKNEKILAQNEEIQIKNVILEQQKEEILTQSENLEQAYDEISTQKDVIEKSHRSMTDSINYAKRIQTAISPSPEFVSMLFPEYFIFFKSRDIVSGDFYYIKQIKQYTIIAVADCTGHGVPGAFMSMLGIAYLNEIVQKAELDTANEVLEELRRKIKNSLQQTGQLGEQQDGMDIALCAIDIETNILNFAGAYNPCWIVRLIDTGELKMENDGNELSAINYQLSILEADHQPVGIYAKEIPFTNHYFQLQKNDLVYLFSDGYHSQFGGEKNEKYKIGRFKNLILNICTKNIEEQKNILSYEFENWKGNKEQTDDVLVIGVKI